MIEREKVRKSGTKRHDSSEVKYRTYDEWQEAFLPDVAARKSFDTLSEDSVELAHKLAKSTFDRTFGSSKSN